MILHTQLRFQDFISKSNYAALQYKFASYDEKYNGLLESKFENFIDNDFSIYYINDEHNHSELSFYNDFLIPKIDILAKSTINKIQQKINTDYKYDKEKRELFIKDVLDDCYKTELMIKNNDFLIIEIKDRLSSQMEIVLEYLKGDYLKNFEFNEKFQFNLIEQDLLVLIAFLRKENKLVNENESQLGLLIEKNFECFDDKTQSYKKIKRANKKLNEIKNNGKSIEKSIIRLRKLFSENSFNNL